MPERKKGVVPRLRFPEFRDAGPWEVKRLGEVAQLISERAGDNDYVLLSVTSGVGLVPQTEKFGREIAGKQKKNYYVIRRYDFAYNKSATKEYPQGYVALYTGNEPAAVPNSIFTCFRPDLDRVVPHYLNYLFGANLHGRWLAKAITVGARAHGSLNVDNSDVLNIPLPLPKVAEQQKIADCLSSLDELIQLEAQKLDALKAHKKGLMQQLFPREGETTPRLRFPEFRDAGPWEVRTVEEIAEKIAQGGTPDTTVPEYWNGDIPWITPAEMGDDALCHYTEKTIRTISERGLKNSSAELLPAHSVIISSRAPIGYVTINKVPMATNQGCKAIVPKQEIYHEFLYFSLLKAKRQLNDLGAGAGFKEISASTLKNFKITLPNRFEQQKIADCLSSLDELIQLEAQKLDALKAHKKGLMQQLFPQEVE